MGSEVDRDPTPFLDCFAQQLLQQQQSLDGELFSGLHVSGGSFTSQHGSQVPHDAPPSRLQAAGCRVRAVPALKHLLNTLFQALMRRCGGQSLPQQGCRRNRGGTSDSVPHCMLAEILAAPSAHRIATAALLALQYGMQLRCMRCLSRTCCNWRSFAAPGSAPPVHRIFVGAVVHDPRISSLEALGPP